MHLFLLLFFLYCTDLSIWSIVATTPTVSLVTFVHAGALTSTMTVAVAFTSVGLSVVLGWQVEAPTPPLILLETMKGDAVFAAVPQQQPLISDWSSGQNNYCHSG